MRKRRYKAVVRDRTRRAWSFFAGNRRTRLAAFSYRSTTTSVYVRFFRDYRDVVNDRFDLWPRRNDETEDTCGFTRGSCACRHRTATTWCKTRKQDVQCSRPPISSVDETRCLCIFLRVFAYFIHASCFRGRSSSLLLVRYGFSSFFLFFLLSLMLSRPRGVVGRLTARNDRHGVKIKLRKLRAAETRGRTTRRVAHDIVVPRRLVSVNFGRGRSIVDYSSRPRRR